MARRYVSFYLPFYRKRETDVDPGMRDPNRRFLDTTPIMHIIMQIHINHIQPSSIINKQIPLLCLSTGSLHR